MNRRSFLSAIPAAAAGAIALTLGSKSLPSDTSALGEGHIIHPLPVGTVVAVTPPVGSIQYVNKIEEVRQTKRGEWRYRAKWACFGEKDIIEVVRFRPQQKEVCVMKKVGRIVFDACACTGTLTSEPGKLSISHVGCNDYPNCPGNTRLEHIKTSFSEAAKAPFYSSRAS